jgi:cytochrome c-type biogenesis protein CcmH
MLERTLFRPLLCLSLALGALTVQAKEAESASANPQLESRMMAVASELRCLVCQNQTIADSHAELAVDLRQQVREQLAAGKSEQEILDYMTQRYGDFVLYRPPFKASTVVLWVGPGVLLVLAVGVLVMVLRRRQRMGADAFDPETDSDADINPIEQENASHVPN